MRKLRVGIWIDKNISPEAGGGYGYYRQLVNKMCQFTFTQAEIVFLSNDNLPKVHKDIPQFAIQWRPVVFTGIQKFIYAFVQLADIRRFSTQYENRLLKAEQELKKELSSYADVIYYPTPECVYPCFPFIYTIWDLGHLSTYAFPELSMNGVFEKRKENISLLSNKALLIFAESVAGKKAIVEYLNIQADRVKVVPLFPSGVVDKNVAVQKPHGINESQPFIHYPAQYWAHKNHFNLIQAFKSVRKQFPDLHLVLTGADKGNKEYILKIIAAEDLADFVIDLGFVSLEEMKWLYLHSLGLVMPSFLGPTNMPVVEAAVLNCPVACSRLEGHLEQLGDYGYYFQPDNIHEMSDTIISMIQDRLKGNTRIYTPLFTIDHAIQAIDRAFTELCSIRFCWGDNDSIY